MKSFFAALNFASAAANFCVSNYWVAIVCGIAGVWFLLSDALDRDTAETDAE